MSRDTICKDASELVGNTPMVYLNNVTEGCLSKIALKLEYFNPGCSVKDRIAKSMIEEAEKAGKLIPGKTVLIEGTSGNTGIGLSLLATAKGYKTILVMPDNMSNERRTLLKAFGADLILTDCKQGVKGVFDRCDQLLNLIPNSIMLNQFQNKTNPLGHYRTTGPEIWRQTDGKVNICVFGVGTGGTITGVGEFLLEKNPEIEMYAVEPFESSVINGLPHGPHGIHGIGAGVIPPVLDTKIFKEAIRVTSEDAMNMAKRLCLEEGLMVGISSGANVKAAIELAKRPENAGKLIVTSAASFGERYLSTELYSDIREHAEQMKATAIEDDYNMLKEKYGITKKFEELMLSALEAEKVESGNGIPH